MLKLKKLTSGLLKNLEQNKLLLNLENFTSHCLKNPEILLVLLIGPLLIRTYCVYVNSFDKICTLNIIYMSYRWKIGKHFAQKMITNTKTDKTSCQGYQKNKESKVVFINHMFHVAEIRFCCDLVIFMSAQQYQK